MKESKYSPTEAATIIQRSLRKYLLRKQQRQRLNKLETLPNSETLKYENEVSEKEKHLLKVHEVRNGLESFYRKASENLNRYKYVNDLIITIDETVRRLENITSLEKCNTTEAHNLVSEDILKEASKRHKEKLDHYDLQWWDKLNL
ncbi:hypothetical protein ILUMI_03824 [Ignelater luminosus]|uniref:Uncharacterized protein n=1 Tax=Ignelater luminosus TaxID=2038154 RepID=A0A8K0DL05_IGNLU|nr:hypothetical protein ILUMI_03824 [Ignelater luminosus]